MKKKTSQLGILPYTESSVTMTSTPPLKAFSEKTYYSSEQIKCQLRADCSEAKVLNLTASLVP